jgi:hypothetical protein
MEVPDSVHLAGISENCVSEILTREERKSCDSAWLAKAEITQAGKPVIILKASLYI